MWGNLCDPLLLKKKLMCNWDLLVWFVLFEQVETGTVKNFEEPSVQKFKISLKQIPIVENDNKEQT